MNSGRICHRRANWNDDGTSLESVKAIRSSGEDFSANPSLGLCVNAKGVIFLKHVFVSFIFHLIMNLWIFFST